MRILDINDIENVKLSETICVLYSHHAVSVCQNGQERLAG